VTAARRAVAVVGPGDTTDAQLLDAAEEIGAGLARAGCTVVTGGLGGVMAAAARGAQREGGTTIGLLPGDDAAAADPAIDIAVPTGLGEMRNVLVVRAATVVVAVGGSWGTLSEVAFARRTGRPVVSLQGWSVTGPATDEIYAATDAADAVRAATSLLASALS
jgi:uncharacterized protein (TIGR00725 family)